MNTVDIRTMNADQKVFWSIAGPTSVAVISIAFFIAFRGRMEENPFRLRLQAKKKVSTSTA
jgi:hypothetical protein